MSASRRRFEGQLAELNNEIAVLSERLRPTSPGKIEGYENDISHELEGKGSKDSKNVIIDGDVGEIRGKNGVNMANSRALKGEAEKLRRRSDDHGEELPRIVAERDALLSKCNKLERVITDLRHELSEMEHTKMELTHLRRDHASLTTSLETSERIRQQQKALITMLQSNIGRTDNSISDRDAGAGDASVSVATSIVAENHVWLNTAIPKGNSSVVSGLSETDTDGESRGSKKRKGRRSVVGSDNNNRLSRNNSGAGVGVGVAFHDRRNVRQGKDFLTRTSTKGPTGRPRNPALPKANLSSKSSNIRNVRSVPRPSLVTQASPSRDLQNGRIRKSSGSTTCEDSQIDSLQLVAASSAAKRQMEHSNRLMYGASVTGTPIRSRSTKTGTLYATDSPARFRGSKSLIGTPMRSRSAGARGTVSMSPMRGRKVPNSPRCTFGSGHK